MWQKGLFCWKITVFPWIIAAVIILFFAKKGVIVQGRRLFQLLFITGSHALNILFCYSIKSKKSSHQINNSLVPWLIFTVNILIVRVWIITDWSVVLHQTPLQLCLSIFNLAGRGSKEEKMARGVGEGAIIQGRWLFLI